MARILIVEDEASIRLPLEYILRQEGHQVAWAESGEEGLRLAERLQPELVLLDLMLPGLDGFEVLQQLKAWPKPPRVLILSARGREVERAKGLALGAEAYLVKPFGLEEMLAEVRRLLE